MKSVKDTLLGRRSIRRYEYDPVTDEQMDLIKAAVRNTPTSYNGQQYSVIDVTDSKVKQHLYELTNQKQIKTCSHFLAFCADYYKISEGARAKGVDMPPFPSTLDGVLVGVIDAALALMSAVVCAESLGLGTCCIGYARTAAPEQIARVLELPEGVFVVCGLAIGVPRELPDLKPKQPTDLVFHTDRYDTAGVADRVLAYDSLIKQYNATRSGTTSDNDWVAHIVGYYREAMHYRMLEAIRSQGFDTTR